MKAQLKDWISAFRLRTLPLAFSSILTGSAIALAYGYFDFVTMVLALLTTLFLQVLSNLANDYGDSAKGTDNENRLGPTRAVQSGAISLNAMKTAIVVCSILCLASGIPLVLMATKGLGFTWPLLFIILGLICIAAAIKYTAGKKAYGYHGLGDLFVFVFFGIVGVGGSFLLQSKNLNTSELLSLTGPILGVGCLSAGVLNLNNMRDHDNDKASNKNTLAVRLGVKGSKRYHLLIVAIGIIAFNGVSLEVTINWQEHLVLTIPSSLVIAHWLRVRKIDHAKDFDPELKRLALGTFFFACTLFTTFLIFR